jgi:squalene synthase HpnC
LDDARAYCRRLACSHYENFTVASWLLPRQLRQHFFNIYAYCRWADDLADETADGSQSLALLDWWEDELRQCYAGSPDHAVFVALRETILQFRIPQQVFADLLVAFRRDQEVNRYATADELLSYCRYSANPVGRLILYLGNCYDDALAAFSDSICTGLQLANFCQDVARDHERGRIYLPQTTWDAVGYTPEMFANREFNEAFRSGLQREVDVAEGYMRAGQPLIGRLTKELKLDVSLFLLGGLSIVEAIRRIDYNVWARRPTVGKWEKLSLLPRAWWMCRTERIQGAGR